MKLPPDIISLIDVMAEFSAKWRHQHVWINYEMVKAVLWHLCDGDKDKYLMAFRAFDDRTAAIIAKEVA